MTGYTCPDTGRHCYGETMDPNYSPSEERKWEDFCEAKGREFASSYNGDFGAMDDSDFHDDAVAFAKRHQIVGRDDFDVFIEAARGDR